ncbi:MAG: UPF0175 family protein [Kiritimatiellae bacterium]|nr:UPF0175 family protein [Kiritimatiellia bacterium]
MKTIHITCPDDVLISLKEDVTTFTSDLRMVAAVKYYEMGRLSSGRAAELAAVSRITFLRRLPEFGVSLFDESREELEEDMKNA